MRLETQTGTLMRTQLTAGLRKMNGLEHSTPAIRGLSPPCGKPVDGRPVPHYYQWAEQSPAALESLYENETLARSGRGERLGPGH